MTSYDEWYEEWMESNLSSACVVRVTNQCDQRCRHCAFRSGPECIGHMTPDTCEQINGWVPNDVVLNIMGGEFSILPDYPAMLLAMTSGRSHVRLITNGSWAHNTLASLEFLETMKQIKAECGRVDVAVSNDQWHVVSSCKAIAALANHRPRVEWNQSGRLDVIPIGRAWDNHLTAKLHASCQVMSNMIITEDGMIGRCPYGYFPWKHFTETTWDEAQDYVWGWRSEKISEGMNCHSCMEAVEATRGRVVGNEASLTKEPKHARSW